MSMASTSYAHIPQCGRVVAGRDGCGPIHGGVFSVSVSGNETRFCESNQSENRKFLIVFLTIQKAQKLKEKYSDSNSSNWMFRQSRFSSRHQQNDQDSSKLKDSFHFCTVLLTLLMMAAEYKLSKHPVL